MLQMSLFVSPFFTITSMPERSDRIADSADSNRSTFKFVSPMRLPPFPQDIKQRFLSAGGNLPGDPVSHDPVLNTAVFFHAVLNPQPPGIYPIKEIADFLNTFGKW
jgi:hypothetical protein